jgi:hypothetical protein
LKIAINPTIEIKRIIYFRRWRGEEESLSNNILSKIKWKVVEWTEKKRREEKCW